MSKRGIMFYARMSLYCFVATLPWQTQYFLRELYVAGEKWQYMTIGVYLSDIFLLAFLGLTLFARRKVVYEYVACRKYSLITLVTATFLTLTGAQVLFTDDPLYSMYRWLWIVVGVALIVCLRWIRVNPQTLIWTFLISLLAHGCIAIFQFFWQADFSSTLLGMSYHDAYVGGVSVMEVASGRWLRGYGGFPHPNILGSFMAMGFLGCLAIYLTSKNVISRVAALSSSMIFLVALFVSFSRTGFISLGFGMVILSFCFFLYRKHLRVSPLMPRVLLAGVVVIVAIGILLSNYSDLVRARVVSENRLEQLSVNERTLQFHESLELISQRPVLGSGLGMYVPELSRLDGFAKDIWKYQPVHNVSLLALAEIGLAGVALLVTLLYLILRRIFSHVPSVDQVSRSQTISFIILFAWLGVFVSSSMLDHWQWDQHTGVFSFFLIIGLMMQLSHNTKRNAEIDYV